MFIVQRTSTYGVAGDRLKIRRTNAIRSTNSTFCTGPSTQFDTPYPRNSRLRSGMLLLGLSVNRSIPLRNRLFLRAEHPVRHAVPEEQPVAQRDAPVHGEAEQAPRPALPLLQEIAHRRR